MPYTPPSQQSPASSRTSTPAISRNASYSHDISALSPSHTRPSLPRSISSTTYLNKHRRSPSVTSPATHDVSMATYKFNSGSKDDDAILMNPSLRQSPPPLNDLVIPTGAIISPPDSSENSDGDEANSRSRRRQVEDTWNELQQAVRSMSVKRDPSPVKNDISTQLPSASEPTTVMASPTKLSPEARKISHSRSSTDTAIPSMGGVSEQETASDDSDDELRGGKPPLVRKKSGELVKPALRPSSRRRYSSMPGTPTYSKTVHFNDNGNQTRHFLQVDKPSAVSAGSSPVETYESETEFPLGGSKKGRIEWDMKLANFPSDDDQLRRTKPVWVERFFLTADNKSLVGTVAVANISFHKSVVARFTLDYWKTTSEVSAEFGHDVRKDLPDGYDRFNFSIRLADQANLETKTLLLCVRYNVIGQEHWDNNDNANYQIDFVKKINRAASHTFTSPLGARPVSAIPRSRHSPPASRGRQRAPSIDDDMTSQLDDSSYRFGAAANDLLGDDGQPAIKLKPRSKRGVAFPHGPAQQAQGLGGRYDFGASLSAALSSAQDKLGKQSGLMSNKQAAHANAGYFTQDSPDPTPKKAVETERPEALATDRPAMGSAQYRDLVSKFCYFTPTAATATKTSSPLQSKATPASTDGTTEQAGSQTPSPQRAASPQLELKNDKPVFSPASGSPYSSRTGSPVHLTRTGHSSSARGSSPGTFGYPYHHKRDGYLSDSPAPTAIHG